jgi:hypothetical protein
VDGADVVIVATNHAEFEGRAPLGEIVARAAENCLLVDPWNSFGTAQVFLFAAESAAMLAPVGDNGTVAPAEETPAEDDGTRAEQPVRGPR